MTVLLMTGVCECCPRLTGAGCGFEYFLTGTLCCIVLSFTTLAVDVGHGSLTAILVAVQGKLRSQSTNYYFSTFPVGALLAIYIIVAYKCLDVFYSSFSSSFIPTMSTALHWDI